MPEMNGTPRGLIPGIVRQFLDYRLSILFLFFAAFYGGFYERFASDSPFDLEGLSIYASPDDGGGYAVRLGTRPTVSIPDGRIRN